MQGLNLQFPTSSTDNFSVVVLNLRAPSVLLGFQFGGIVGHRFLSLYRVALDLQRSGLRLTRLTASPARRTERGLQRRPAAFGRFAELSANSRNAPATRR